MATPVQYDGCGSYLNRRCFVAQAISPFNDVAAVTTPTLIVCGEKDWNVPVSQVDLRLPVTVVVAART